MPQAAAIIAAIAAVAGAGTGIYEATKGQPKPPTLQSQSNQLVAQEEAQRKVASGEAQQQLPGLEYAGGGGLNPGYLEQQSAIASGNAGLLGTQSLNQAVNQFLGLGTSGAGAGSGSSILPGLAGGSVTPGISDATRGFFGNVSNQDQFGPFQQGGVFGS